MRVAVAGALGEVGRGVVAALRSRGHDVVRLSSRAPIDGESDLLALTSPWSADLLVNCAGRGDRRVSERTGRESLDRLADRCEKLGIRGVLLSTTRVMEGHDTDFEESAPVNPRTPYAQANCEIEQSWLTGSQAHVLRITNFFGAPHAYDSPQSMLLPWSLVTEALETGKVAIRSGPGTLREFVDSTDLVCALEIVAAASDPPTVMATVPGTRFTLADLTGIVADAFVMCDRAVPSFTFGADSVAAVRCRPGWLADQGWQGDLTAHHVTAVIAGWIRTHT